jgi:hypothetical protein
MSNIAAIGLSTFPNLARVGQSSAILEMQLARYQAQLADWMSCPSCNTPEGKAKIRELSDKVSETKQRIDVADTQNQGRAPAVSAGSKVLAAQTLNVVGSGGLPASGQASATGSIGTILNVLA